MVCVGTDKQINRDAEIQRYRETDYRDTEIEVRKQMGKRGKSHVPGFDSR